MIKLEESVCSDFGQASGREWLETNGLGGFACSTIMGMNSRRYHGLLTVATHPPVGRILLLSKLEETLVVEGQRVDLGTNQYVGAIHPRGFDLMSEFRLDPFPISIFEWQGVQIEKTVFMVHDSNTVVVQYRLLQAPPSTILRLEIRPFIACRDCHSTTHENNGLDPSVQLSEQIASVGPYAGQPRLYLAHNAGAVDTHGDWYRQFLYSMEAERGLDAVEDLFNPMRLDFQLSVATPATIIASTEPHNISNAERFRIAESTRRKDFLASPTVNDPLVQQLAVAARQFLVRRGDGYTLIAGYPWFTDWGRDTMISLPGLMHLEGSAEIAKQILREFARHVNQGMLPNRFPEEGESAEFNNVDATLWFFEAARAYVARTGDVAFIKDELYDVFTNIMDWHMRGTRFNIHVQDDGLLHAGVPGVQLTWMDAKVGDWVVTPRIGNPVEVQALWFNALKIMEEWAETFRDTEKVDAFRTSASLARQSFNRVFWNVESQCLYDVVQQGHADASIRPNQLFAISLHHPILDIERFADVLRVIDRDLLTPYGLRTLNSNDPQYKGRYEGDAAHRDSAYHQGTVWPWLLGPYITAYCKVHGFSAETRAHVRNLLKPLESHLTEAGLGQISEIYDGDAPQRPRGCFAQAWSVFELLRVLHEDIYRSGSMDPATEGASGETRFIAGSSAKDKTSSRDRTAAAFRSL